MLNKISDYVKIETIELNLKAKNKKDVIKELHQNILKSNLVKDEELALKDLYSRENMGSTGIGKSVALPHAKTDAVDKMIITVGISRDGIEYDSIDNQPVHIFFMFLCPKADSNEYLRVLARISRWIREDDNFNQNILKAKTTEEIVDLIKKEDNNE